MSNPPRIGIDARLISGTTGGVEQVIIGLASALSALVDGDEEYLFLTYTGADDWLSPYLRGPCHRLPGPPPSDPLKVRLMHRYPALRALWHRVLSPLLGVRSVSVPTSDGTIERAGIDLMHFTLQTAFTTELPSIYQPHDLQHLHLPSLFTPRERLKREVLYRTFCAQSRMIVVMSAWGKRDLVEHYHLPEDKVRIVHWGCVLDFYPTPQERDLTAARQRFNLPERFIFYPARMWPHKNHLGLLEALALLRDRDGLVVPLVSSGGFEASYSTIRKRVRQWRLDDQVRFLGFVSPLELQCLYRLCRGLVFPSKFEGWGLPVTEAFAAGVPVACSNVTSLPELAGDAALLFDPYRPDQIADAIRRLWTDEELSRTLIERGYQRIRQFTWDRAARLFRAHYRRLLDRPLTDEDQMLLAEG